MTRTDAQGGLPGGSARVLIRCSILLYTDGPGCTRCSLISIKICDRSDELERRSPVTALANPRHNFSALLDRTLVVECAQYFVALRVPTLMHMEIHNLKLVVLLPEFSKMNVVYTSARQPS